MCTKYWVEKKLQFDKVIQILNVASFIWLTLLWNVGN